MQLGLPVAGEREQERRGEIRGLVSGEVREGLVRADDQRIEPMFPHGTDRVIAAARELRLAERGTVVVAAGASRALGHGAALARSCPGSPARAWGPVSVTA